jgi:hypothetical protein
MSSICTLLGTTGLVALTLLFGSGCSPKSEGGAGGNSSKPANASNKNAGALLLDAGDAMEKSDWKAALASLDLVIADPKASVEEKSTAWQEKVVCEGRAGGDDAASAVLKKIEDGKVELEAKYYFRMCQELSDAGLLHTAIEVVEKAKAKFGSDPKLNKQLRLLARKLNKKLVEAGDTAGSEKLKSLGYLTGSDDDE